MSVITPKQRQIQRYGWLPDLPDHRDRIYVPSWQQALKDWSPTQGHISDEPAPAPPGPPPIPDSVDLSDKLPTCYDQGNLGSCTANAIAAAAVFVEAEEGEQKLQSDPASIPSRLFIYYNERVIEGTVNQDAGAMLRDGLKVLAQQGFVYEDKWAYDITKFAQAPPPELYDAAKPDVAISYESVTQSRSVMQAALIEGFGFVVGFTVYESFESIGSDGIMPMPAITEGVLGGHAVFTCGYRTINAKLHYKCRNSWSPSWGTNGYFWMPAEYLENSELADDFWLVRKI